MIINKKLFLRGIKEQPDNNNFKFHVQYNQKPKIFWGIFEET